MIDLSKNESNNSEDTISLELSALEYINQGKLSKAEKIYRDLINNGTDNHITYGNLAIICGVMGNRDDMIKFLKESIKIEPRYVQAYNNLGIALRDENDLESAIKLFEKAINIKPDYLDAYLNLGMIMYKKNDIKSAKNYYNKVLKIDPKNINAFNSLGITYEYEKKFEKAISFYKKALEIDPLSSEINRNLGNSLFKKGQIDQAITSYKKSLKINPKDSSSHNNLASALKKKGLFDEAVSAYNYAIRYDPKNAKAFFNLGVLLAENGNNNSAINAYQKSINVNPDYIESYTNLGIIYQEEGKIELAINSYEKALRIEPKNAKSRWNLAIAQLLTGNYIDGWRNYEWRLNNINSNKLHSSPSSKPIFDNIIELKEDLLVVSEQGLGDTIQYMRYIPYLRELGLNIHFSAQKKLHSLIKSSNIDSNPLTPEDASLVNDKKWIPLLSIPKNLAVTPNNPIVYKPYIKSKKKFLDKWKKELFNENKPIIGINWQGNLNMENVSYKGRSIPLENFSIILKQNDITFLSLQKGYGSDQLKNCSFVHKFVSCQNKIDQTLDFAENAAIAANCNLIITCDTSIAHLAGGMGLKVWLLLKDVPFWTWGLHGKSSFWYPTMRIFRQYKKDDWISLFDKVGLELRKELINFYD